jgi:hypothetical protein
MASLVSGPVHLTKYSFHGQEVDRGIYKFYIPSSPQNNKYSTLLLPRCATKFPSFISKRHHSAQLDPRWRSDLAKTGGGGGVSYQMVGSRYQCSTCVCCADQAEQLSEDTTQAPAPNAPLIHGPLNLGGSQVRITFPFLSSPIVVFSLA